MSDEVMNTQASHCHESKTECDGGTLLIQPSGQETRWSGAGPLHTASEPCASEDSLWQRYLRVQVLADEVGSAEAHTGGAVRHQEEDSAADY